jgi:hypothetical protein
MRPLGREHLLGHGWLIYEADRNIRILAQT